MQICIKVLIDNTTNSKDRECIRDACEQLSNLYPQFFKITIAQNGFDFSPYIAKPEKPIESFSKVLLGEYLLEDMIKIGRYDIEISMVSLPLVYSEKKFIPISMFCYDDEEKKASIAISVDVLRSPMKEEYAKNILVQMENQLGLLITGRNCENKRCPDCFQSNIAEISYCQKELCTNCIELLSRRIPMQFTYS
jgi:hypothetical protein